ADFIIDEATVISIKIYCFRGRRRATFGHNIDNRQDSQSVHESEKHYNDEDRSDKRNNDESSNLEAASPVDFGCFE
ncbi:unnamed protein product, partial [marine sediment metagenome]